VVNKLVLAEFPSVAAAFAQTIYGDPQMVFGEAKAARWLVSKYGQKNTNGLGICKFLVGGELAYLSLISLVWRRPGAATDRDFSRPVLSI
jgi:hypothetical protein